MRSESPVGGLWVCLYWLLVSLLHLRPLARPVPGWACPGICAPGAVELPAGGNVPPAMLDCDKMTAPSSHLSDQPSLSSAHSLSDSLAGGLCLCRLSREWNLSSPHPPSLSLLPGSDT